MKKRLNIIFYLILLSAPFCLLSCRSDNSNNSSSSGVSTAGISNLVDGGSGTQSTTILLTNEEVAGTQKVILSSYFNEGFGVLVTKKVKIVHNELDNTLVLFKGQAEYEKSKGLEIFINNEMKNKLLAQLNTTKSIDVTLIGYETISERGDPKISSSVDSSDVWSFIIAKPTSYWHLKPIFVVKKLNQIES